MAWQPRFYGEGHSFEMVLIREGIERGCRWEDFIPIPYKDKHKSGFKWAIAFGHVFGGDIDPVELNEENMEFKYKGVWRRELTREEGLEIFLADMESKMRWLRKQITAPHCTTYMFNALGLLTLNAGEGNVGKGPVLPLLNEERYMAAAVAFLHHNKSWQQVKDANGAIIFGDDGNPKLELLPDNGLTVRRCTEIDLFSTRKDK